MPRSLAVKMRPCINPVKDEKSWIKSRIQLADSIVSDSDIIASQGESSVSVAAQKFTGDQVGVSDTNAVTVKKKESYALIRPITPAVPFLSNSPAFDCDTKIRLDKVTYMKTDDKCVCGNEFIEDEYRGNKEGTKKNSYINCVKPHNIIALDERNPFGEYVIPLFKTFSAVYQNVVFQGCEKGTDANRCSDLYGHIEKARKRFVDGVGYTLFDSAERLLIGSSGEDNEEHKKEDSIKLLECSIRVSRMEMERVKSASFKTYKNRKMFTYLYSKDKIIMLSTCVVDKDHYGYVTVAEARTARTWDARFCWLKVVDMFLATNEVSSLKQRLLEIRVY